MTGNDDKLTTAPRQCSYPPPPLDPFERFKHGPWPRSDKEQENAFIQFRRAADDHFRALFSGFPKMFGAFPTDSNDVQARIDEMMQDMQNMRRSMDADENDFRDRMKAKKDCRRYRDKMKKQTSEEQELASTNDTAQPWWLRGNAAKCPALQENTQKAKKCPAMYDEVGNPRTELDMYEAMEASTSAASNSPINQGWNGLGWDGKQMKKEERKETEHKSERQILPRDPVEEIKGSPDAAINERRWSDFNTKDKADRPWTWTAGTTTAANPFTDHTATVPWLMTSYYSPVLLANPEMGRPSVVKVNQQEGKPFQVSTSGHRFLEPTALDKELAQFPWADAFEDLISLERAGQMVDRSYSTHRVPPTWIHDCINRGSFGRGWGFTADGMLTKNVIRPDVTNNDIPASKPEIKEPPRAESKKPDSRNNRETLEGVVTNVSKDLQRRSQEAIEKAFPGGVIPTEEQIEQAVDETKQWARQMLKSFSIPVTEDELDKKAEAVKKAVISALGHPVEQQQQVAEELRNLVADANSLSLPRQDEPAEMEVVSTADDNIIENEQKTASMPPSAVNTTWSSNSSAWSSNPPSEDGGNSIISTMTQTESRTLPDGSLETRRVLKRRFADGREQTEETVDVENFPQQQSPPRRQGPSFPSSMLNKASQTMTPIQNELKKQKDESKGAKGGWFWK